MNLKNILKVISVLGIFDKLRFNKNRKKKNIKEKNIKQKNTILKKDNKESPSYTNITYEYTPSTRTNEYKSSTKTRKYQQPKNFSIESTMEWKYCPYCDKRINKKAKKCPYCDYDFETGHIPTRRTKTQPQPKNFSIESTMEWKYCPDCDKRINKKAKKCPYCDYDFETGHIPTRTINKNGLSFECPDYYDIGIYKSEDETYKSIVALSKKDRECEIYVMEYRPTTFHWKLRKNSNLLKKELELIGYDNVTRNTDLRYCFDAIVFTQMGAIKTTILFNFDTYKEFIIVCNRRINSDYYCIYDMKIINDSISSI